MKNLQLSLRFLRFELNNITENLFRFYSEMLILNVNYDGFKFFVSLFFFVYNLLIPKWIN